MSRETEIVIRTEQPDDHDDLARILDARGLASEDFVDSGSYFRLVAADSDGRAIGFIDGRFDAEIDSSIHPEPGTYAFGSMVAVDPTVARTGVGRALLRSLLIEAAEHGCTYFVAVLAGYDDPEVRRSFARTCGLTAISSDFDAEDTVGAPITTILDRLAD